MQTTRFHTPIALHQFAPSVHVGCGGRLVSIHWRKRYERQWTLWSKASGSETQICGIWILCFTSRHYKLSLGQRRYHRLTCIVRCWSLLKANRVRRDLLTHTRVWCREPEQCWVEHRGQETVEFAVYVIGLTTDESKSFKIVRNMAVGEGAIRLHELLTEYQPDIINRNLSLLMWTMNWSIRQTDPVTAINGFDLRIKPYRLHAPLPEEQKQCDEGSFFVRRVASRVAELAQGWCKMISRHATSTPTKTCREVWAHCFWECAWGQRLLRKCIFQVFRWFNDSNLQWMGFGRGKCEYYSSWSEYWQRSACVISHS